MAADKRGVTLIELAVAVSVIAVALVGIIALARTGQRAEYDTVAEYRTTEFARNTMATLRLFSDRAAEDPDPTAWVRFWADFSHGDYHIRQTVCNPDVIKGSPTGVSDDLYSLYGDNNTRTNWWSADPMDINMQFDSDDFTIRYRMSIVAAGGDPEITYDSTNNPPPFVGVTLHVFYGNSTANGATFYGIFDNKGRLP